MNKNFKQISFFCGLGDEIIKRISEIGVIRKYLSNEMIIWQGDDCKSVFFILTGKIEIFRISSAGREQILNRLKTGDFFNLAPAMQTTALNLSNARTIDEAELFVLEKSELVELILQYPDISIRIARYLAQRLAYMTDLAEQLALYTVQQRLARFLVQQAEWAHAEKWTQDEIARRLGTVREVISRTLRKFSKEGLIHMEKNQIVITDRNLLEVLASGGE